MVESPNLTVILQNKPPSAHISHLITRKDEQFEKSAVSRRGDSIKQLSALPSLLIPGIDKNTETTTNNFKNALIGPKQPSVNKLSRPRRKKMCPTCNKLFSNLTTHKATHLKHENRPHKCTTCAQRFTRNNDLVRHRKRHWQDGTDGRHMGNIAEIFSEDEKSKQLEKLHQIKGAFKCPYNSTLIKLDVEMYPFKKAMDLNFDARTCHSTGVFSRCDTFRNHLKALHFQYPPGTHKAERSTVSGKCRHCGMHFDNVDQWLNEHVGRKCGFVYH